MKLIPAVYPDQKASGAGLGNSTFIKIVKEFGLVLFVFAVNGNLLVAGAFLAYYFYVDPIIGKWSRRN